MTSAEDPRPSPAPDRRRFIAGATGLAGALLVPGAASAQDASDANADFLFVQTADAMAFDADRTVSPCATSARRRCSSPTAPSGPPAT